MENAFKAAFVSINKLNNYKILVGHRKWKEARVESIDVDCRSITELFCFEQFVKLFGHLTTGTINHTKQQQLFHIHRPHKALSIFCSWFRQMKKNVEKNFTLTIRNIYFHSYLMPFSLQISPTKKLINASTQKNRKPRKTIDISDVCVRPPSYFRI